MQFKKWAEGLNKHFPKKGNPEGQQEHEKMLDITNYQEMQIKTTMRFHLTPVRMAIIKKNTNNKFWQRWGENEIILNYIVGI